MIYKDDLIEIRYQCENYNFMLVSFELLYIHYSQISGYYNKYVDELTSNSYE